jgi:hypothetical protein
MYNSIIFLLLSVLACFNSTQAMGLSEQIIPEAQSMPAVTVENIEKYPQYKDHFIQHALEHELSDALMVLVQKYPECAPAISFKLYTLLFGSQKSPDTAKFLAERYEELFQDFKLTKVEDTNIQSLFDELKVKMGIRNGISLFATANPKIGSDAAAIVIHDIVIINSESRLPIQMWKFVLAHELGHVLKKHTGHHYFIKDQKQGLPIRHKNEYEADEIAVLTLGSIAEAMEFLHATPDASAPFGWKLPADTNDSTNDHPSDANRCRALLAVVEKYPDKFQKKK